MPDLLLELFSEEIPARFQQRAAADLRKLVTDALVEGGLSYEGAKEYWTPRRLALDVRGVTARSADIRQERKGPRTDAPQKAIAGFLRGAGLESIDQARVKSDPKKGDFYVAVIEKPGRDAKDIIAEAMPEIIRNFPWPKSMRWGEASREAGSLKWVRPLQSILCTFGPETEEPEIIPFEISGLKSGDETIGHRFLSPGPIKVKRFGDYVDQLEKAKVLLDTERRQETILADAKNLAFAQGFELVEDPGLLAEVANLVEWPTVLMGEFDEAFLDIPAEVIRLTIKENQKCFVMREQGTDKLVNRFMLVTNIMPSDGGAKVARGNGKVVAARLADAKFFWESDLQQTAKEGGFDEWVSGLDNVTFHAKLGSQGERIKRVEVLAEELAKPVFERLLTSTTGSEERSAKRSEHERSELPSDKKTSAEEALGRSGRSEHERSEFASDKELAKLAKRAAHLAKADLQSAMVFEFPEVQGKMGRRYAELAGEDASVAQAIEEHYKPLGPTDEVPTNLVSITVALADKLDTLTGFWAIDEKPTGSKDPYALRRAALGVIRLVIENGVRLHLSKWADGDLISFFHDRLKVFLKDEGVRHDVIDAVITEQADDLLILTLKARALQKLVSSDDGENLIQGYRRAANILAAEEKKGTAVAEAINADLFESDEERALFETLEDVEKLAGNAIEAENFEEAMSRLASLRAPIDNFFEHVHVNADDEKTRANRLALLTRIRAATATVADLSKIGG